MKACRPYKQTYPLKNWVRSNILEENYPTFCFPSGAKAAGYKTKTQWKALGRIVVAPEFPSAIVPTSKIVQTTCYCPDVPYLRRDGEICTRSTGYHSYYSLDRTIPKPTKSSIRSIPPLSLRDSGHLTAAELKLPFGSDVVKTSVPTESPCNNADSAAFSCFFPLPPFSLHYDGRKQNEKYVSPRNLREQTHFNNQQNRNEKQPDCDPVNNDGLDPTTERTTISPATLGLPLSRSEPASGGIDLAETKNTKKAYVPATFDPASVPEFWQPYIHHIEDFCHILHHRRLQEQLSREDYVPLKAEYLRLELGKVGKSQRVWDIIRPYILSEVAETDHQYGDQPEILRIPIAAKVPLRPHGVSGNSPCHPPPEPSPQVARP